MEARDSRYISNTRTMGTLVSGADMETLVMAIVRGMDRRNYSGADMAYYPGGTDTQ